MLTELHEKAALTIQRYYNDFISRKLDNMSTELDSVIFDTISLLLKDDEELFGQFMAAYSEDILNVNENVEMETERDSESNDGTLV